MWVISYCQMHYWKYKIATTCMAWILKKIIACASGDAINILKSNLLGQKYFVAVWVHVHHKLVISQNSFAVLTLSPLKLDGTGKVILVCISTSVQPMNISRVKCAIYCKVRCFSTFPLKPYALYNPLLNMKIYRNVWSHVNAPDVNGLTEIILYQLISRIQESHVSTFLHKDLLLGTWHLICIYNANPKRLSSSQASFVKSLGRIVESNRKNKFQSNISQNVCKTKQI